ncbi:MAG: phosphotransferase [Saprospiraceae bacterium]|nr:phosphotransferase [Saprospiraceae bacterium]HRD79155.1 RNase adapter RapZ [Saprospiraceae bacterium]HRF39460.1 RNase adapter RapZ [Saprospiraceae bacterium]HRJ13747.1 RNase adapter RapZ [Saprospiraceae bacterium]HRK80623.1 RNase adapter RapZ [Saprospiraceae bacterium]
MVPVKIEHILADLFEKWAGESAYLVLPLAPSGSQRVYYRLQGPTKTAIGAYNPNRKENQAFISFSRHFKARQLPVPEIYAEDLDQDVYLQEDLGSTTLYSYLLQKGEYFPDYLVQIYRKAVEQLARLQIEGGKDLDYSVCYPRDAFDRQSMVWDFNTFKYYFLRLAYVPFDEQALEADFQRLADFLLQADCNHFMFRDFQTRNIMIKSGEPYFIDYQGGRRGALQYDLASLLYQAKAGMPEDIRQELLEHYIKTAGQFIHIDREQFIQYYHGYVLIRSIQTFGTYGFRGLFERKEYFLESIPFALRNVRWILENAHLPVEMPELTRAMYHLIESKRFEPFDKIKGASSLLTVTINSFSYKSGGIPEDPHGNGGGFVFDCRCINNPGRYEPYKKLTGRDEPVINFLKHHSHMGDYLNSVFHLVNDAVEDYIERSFTHLSVNFGCTGGQHRSVYAADALARHLKDKYGVRVELRHIEQERKNWQN